MRRTRSVAPPRLVRARFHFCAIANAARAAHGIRIRRSRPECTAQVIGVVSTTFRGDTQSSFDEYIVVGERVESPKAIAKDAEPATGPGTEATLDADQCRGSETAAPPVAESYVVDHSLSAKRKAEQGAVREVRKRGAILAHNRKSEGYPFSTGVENRPIFDPGVENRPILHFRPVLKINPFSTGVETRPIFDRC